MDRANFTTTKPVIAIEGLTKTYASGLQALKRVYLEIRKGEIFALLGPNGAGKTTLISIVCGIVTPTSGTVLVDGFDIKRDYRATRARIGLVPQELHTDMFETVAGTVAFSRGLFGCAPKPDYVDSVLRDLSLYDKRNDKIMTLSGGMKRRVLIAKALAHEPQILFLDEPTAGVDVELRRDMWALVRRLRDRGVTIILTTHYIDEAEEMADRIGVVSKGELIVVEEKTVLMKKLGKKQLTLHLQEPMKTIPGELGQWNLALKNDGSDLEYTFDASEERTAVSALLRRIDDLGIAYTDLNTRQSSLEDIFVTLVSERMSSSIEVPAFNRHAVRAIYRFEMARAARTVWQSLVTPVITTALYFIVFGAAIGSRMSEVDGVPYGAFIVPGLIMLSLFTESLSNASFGIYLPRFTGTIYEILSAPVSPFEMVIGYVGAAATKSVILGLVILATATFFVPVRILHPFAMVAFLVLTATTFSLFGFIIGVWAKGFEQLQFIPMLIVTPLTFLGGAFYSIDMLPDGWRAFSLINPAVYLISGFRWSFYGSADVAVGVSLSMTLGFFLLGLVTVYWIFRTGYRLKT